MEDLDIIRPNDDFLYNLYLRRVQRAEQTPHALDEALGSVTEAGKNIGEYATARELAKQKMSGQAIAQAQLMQPFLRANLTEEEKIEADKRKVEQDRQDLLARIYPYGGSRVGEKGLEPIVGKDYPREAPQPTGRLIPNPYFQYGIGEETATEKQIQEYRNLYVQKKKGERGLGRKTPKNLTPNEENIVQQVANMVTAGRSEDQIREYIRRQKTYYPDIPSSEEDLYSAGTGEQKKGKKGLGLLINPFDRLKQGSSAPLGQSGQDIFNKYGGKK